MRLSSMNSRLTALGDSTLSGPSLASIATDVIQVYGGQSAAARSKSSGDNYRVRSPRCHPHFTRARLQCLLIWSEVRRYNRVESFSPKAWRPAHVEPDQHLALRSQMAARSEEYRVRNELRRIQLQSFISTSGSSAPVNGRSRGARVISSHLVTPAHHPALNLNERVLPHLAQPSAPNFYTPS